MALASGWAEADVSPAASVTVGDRTLPREVIAQFLSVDGQPALDLRCEVVDGIPQCREVRVVSVDGGREVKPLDLRAVNLTEWVPSLFALFAMRSGDDGPVVTLHPETTDEELDATADFLRARRGKAARKITPAFLALVAQVYRENLERAPTQAVADTFGVRHRAASLYVRAARDAGLLGETSPGKKGV